MDWESLIKEIEHCRVCAKHLEHGVNPVFSIHPANRIAIVGHAPGRKVHASGIPWQDASGERLRDWLGVTAEEFYGSNLFAIVPMGFCYPGKAKSGDHPPRPECAPLWHHRIWQHLPALQLTLLVGKFAQNYYLEGTKQRSLTETVRNFRQFLPQYLPLPHPSPRNNIWLKKNLWFGEEVVPHLRERIKIATH